MLSSSRCTFKYKDSGLSTDIENQEVGLWIPNIGPGGIYSVIGYEGSLRSSYIFERAPDPAGGTRYRIVAMANTLLSGEVKPTVTDTVNQGYPPLNLYVRTADGVDVNDDWFWWKVERDGIEI